MKDYFNKDERDLHIKTIACQGEIETFIESEAITKEERKCLRYANTYLKKFTASVFDRLGKDYIRRLQNALKDNRLLLVGNYAPAQSAVKWLDEEILLPYVREMQNLFCMWCEKEDYKGCPLCRFMAELSLDGSNPEGGCPYKM